MDAWRRIAGLVFAGLLLCGSACASSRAERTPIWSDEFDGSVVNPLKWEFQIGDGTAYGLPAGWGNNELQHYTNDPSNVFVSDGALHIVARRAQAGGPSYTSARLRTRGFGEFRYGRIEARIDLPRGQGIWPAFWMLPTDSPYGGWAAGGEIDIMETVNEADAVHGTLHFGGRWPRNQSTGGELNDGTDWAADYHVYAIEWEPDEMRWYVDDVMYSRKTAMQWYSESDTDNRRAPFDYPFHLLLNIAVGGNWPGNPDDTTSFPQTMRVDYVRVYALEQSAWEGTAWTVPGVIEAEHWDNGGPGLAYQDSDVSNPLGAFRREADVETALRADDRVVIADVVPGEWLEYTIDVSEAGAYALTLHASSPFGGGTFAVSLDGRVLAEGVRIPATGSFESFGEARVVVPLEAGEHELRLTFGGQLERLFEVDRLELVPADGPCSDADLAAPFGSLDFFDVSAFLAAFGDAQPQADLNGDGQYTFFDVSAYLTLFGAGCG